MLPHSPPQVGLGSERPQMSEGTMGAAGKMEHFAQTGATSACVGGAGVAALHCCVLPARTDLMRICHITSTCDRATSGRRAPLLVQRARRLPRGG